MLEFLALHTGLGAAIGVAFACLTVLSNFAGLGTLLENTSEPFIPMLLFFASFALTFGSLKVGIAVMTLPLELPERDMDEGEGGDDAPPSPRAEQAAEDPNRLLGRRE